MDSAKFKPLPQTYPEPDAAIITTRVSRDAQEDNTSHEAQYLVCEKKMGELGATLYATFRETVSGALYRARPDMQEALRLIEAGKAKYLIVARLDRAGRDVDALRDIKRRVERAGGQLVFADGLQVAPGAVGNLLFNQLSSFAEFERELIRERMVSGLRARAGQGLQVARSQSAWGYHVVTHADVIRGAYPPEQVGRYQPVKEHWPAIEAAFTRIAARESLRSVCGWLTTQGIKTPRGGNLWRAQTLASIIRNPVYKGEPAYSRTQRITDEGRRLKGMRNIAYEKPRPESEWIKLEAPAVVSRELWQAANDALSTGRAERSGRIDRKYMLSGLVRCPQCGRRLYSRTTNRLTNYRCNGAILRQAQDRRACESPHYSRQGLETLALEAVRELLNDPALIQQAQARYQQARKRSGARQSEAEELKRLHRALETTRRREATLAESVIEARMQGSDGAAFSRLLRETEGQRQKLEQQVTTLEARQAQGVLSERPLLEPQAVEPLEAALFSPTLASAQKGLILARFIERVYPVPLADLPAELSVSARQARIAAGKQKGETNMGKRKRHTGGIQLVLRTARPGPYYILSRVLHKKTPYRDNSGRDGFKLHYKTTLTIEPSDPFPYSEVRRAAFEDELEDEL